VDRASATRSTRAVDRPGLPLVLASLGMILAIARAPGVLAGEPSPEGQVIREIRIVGNDSVTSQTIREKITSRVNRPLDLVKVDKDIRDLKDTKLFSDVSTGVARSSAGDGVILTYQVVEMPVLKRVEFIGRKAVKLKDIEQSTGLKVGARADSGRVRMAVREIAQLYKDKGYENVEVRLLKGGRADDREAVFSIFEGPKYKVGEIDFVGNSFASDAVLRTKLASRKPLLGLLPSHYEPEGFDDDARKLAEYYQSHGYLAVTVRPVVRAGADLGSRDATFVIDEGKRFRVREVLFEGNRVLSSKQLKSEMKLHSGEFFNDAVQTADREGIKRRYHAMGHIDAQVQVEPKVTPQPDVVDLVYRIDEGDEYTLGQLIVVGNERTQDHVIRREADFAGLLPGEKLDQTRLDKFKTRVANLGYFQMNPQQGKPLDVKIVRRRPSSKPFGDDGSLPDLGDLSPARMQNSEDDAPPGGPPPLDLPSPLEATPPTVTPGGGSSPIEPFGGSSRAFSPQPDTLPVPIQVPSRGPDALGPIPGVRRPGDRKLAPQPPGPAGSLYDETNPSSAAPGFPNGNLNPNITDRQEPFTANKAYADVIASVDEAPTAKFSVGVGASSFGGLYGNLSVTENNFNILAFPRSFDDFRQGRAFRGAGQQLSIDLSPGTLLNYYSISFRDPYLFDLPLGLGIQGYQTSRFFHDWREQRSGGKFYLGKQFGTSAYGELAYRIEDVAITGFRYPAPAALLDVAGHTLLSSIRPSFRVDTRDNPFLPSAGGYYETAFEQGFGTYTFSKVTAEARQYITTGSRPDGTGKRVLTLRGFFGVSGRDTPIYERFFAGNLNSLRGFQYRGVGPYVLTVNTGGILTTLASAEYRFPWTANDHVQQVFFVDSGTVENDYKFTDYRVSVGTGFRILIPQVFKQVPLALDLAIPVHKGPHDRIQAFNFSIGATF